MALRSMKVATAVSPDEFNARSKIAKALWIVEQGDNRPTDPEQLQSEFDSVKNEWIGKAIKVKKTLDLLGYEVKKK
jgi:hypothetical protein